MSDAGELVPTGRRVDLAPGAGPRHVAFSPDALHLFVLNELDSTLVAFRRDAAAFVQVDSVSTLPTDFRGHNQASAVRVSARGRVYAANRGHDSIAVFRFDGDAKHMEAIQHQPTGGREPRDFVLTRDGGQLLVGNQDSDTVASFGVGDDGRLTFERLVSAPTPSCLVIAGQ